MLEAVAAFLVKTTVILGMANGVCSIRGLSAAERHAAASIGVLGVAMVGVFACLPTWNIAVPAGLIPGHWAPMGLARPPAEAQGEPTVLAIPQGSGREIPVWGWLSTVYIATVVVLGTGSVCRQLRVGRRIRRLSAWRGHGPDGVGVLVDTCATPWTWGLRRPVIVLPQGFDSWSIERQQAAIAHEMGHIRRRDWLIDQIAEWLCNIFWFQPLIWITWRRQRVFAERACDDVVLAGGGDACDYAETLLAVARENGTPKRSDRLPMAMAGDHGTLAVRVEAVLQLDARRRPLTSSKRWSFAVLGLTIAFPLGTAAVTTTQDRDLFEPTEAQAVFLDRPGLGWHASLDSSELVVTGCCTCHAPQPVAVGVQGTLPTPAWALAEPERDETPVVGLGNDQRPATSTRGPAC